MRTETGSTRKSRRGHPLRGRWGRGAGGFRGSLQDGGPSMKSSIVPAALAVALAVPALAQGPATRGMKILGRSGESSPAAAPATSPEGPIANNAKALEPRKDPKVLPSGSVLPAPAAVSDLPKP